MRDREADTEACKTDPLITRTLINSELTEPGHHNNAPLSIMFLHSEPGWKGAIHLI